MSELCLVVSLTVAVLKTAPFEVDSEDWTAFVACVALTLTTIGGFALIMDDPTTRTYESAVLAVILIGINVFCIATEILIIVFVDCGLGERCQRCCRGGGGGEKTGNNSKVVPMTTERQKRIDAGADNFWGQELSKNNVFAKKTKLEKQKKQKEEKETK